MNSLYLIGIYFISVTVIGFAIMGIDKRRARRSAFRVPEATLFSVALIGGSIGTILGMLFFRHKTKNWAFKIGLPLILLLQIAVFVLLYYSPIDFSFL